MEDRYYFKNKIFDQITFNNYGIIFFKFDENRQYVVQS